MKQPTHGHRMPLVVACTPLSELPVPSLPSEIGWCRKCGAEVWFSQLTRDELHREHRDRLVLFECLGCLDPAEHAGDEQVTTTASQIRSLRGLGMTNADIAQALALAATAASVRGSRDQVVATIVADPTGELARSFQAGYLKWLMIAAGVP